MPELLTLPITDYVLQFTALVVIALVVQLTIERLHLPGLIGLLIIGLIIGPGGAGIFPREPVIELLGSVGLVYLMFMAGVEVDLGIIRDHKRETITFGLLAFALSFIPAAIVGYFYGFGWRPALLLGVLLSSHTLVAYPIVARLGLLHRKPIVAAIGGTLITDTLALIALAILLHAQGIGESSGGEGESGGGGFAWLIPLVLLAILAVVSLWGFPRLSRLIFDRINATRAEKALYILAVVLSLASLAELIGAEDILGAFLAGLCLNRVLDRRDVLHEHVRFVGNMLFIPFFFIYTGTLLELDVLARAAPWIMAAILAVVLIFGKFTASWLSGWWFGYTSRERFIMAGLTLPQAAATLAVTIAAREADLFPIVVVDAVIILIFLSCLTGPLLTRYAARPLATERERQHEEHSPREA